MNWSTLLLFFLLLILILKTPGIIRLRSPRDAAAFYGLWALTVLITFADKAELPQLRPLDWVRSIMELLS